LYNAGSHDIYWLGTMVETAFRCNSYLIRDGREALIVDPGSRHTSQQLQQRVAQILPPEEITGLILCHQDPDVAASMVDWLQINPQIRIITSPRTHVLLPHYGITDYDYHDIAENPLLRLPSGAELEFIEAPFLHSPGAFATYDRGANVLFSGDIWAALDMDWRLIVRDMASHMVNMDLFHLDYMASNVAARGFIKRLGGKTIDAIMPQHGSIIDQNNVPAALDYLENLQCGTDLIYAELT